VHQRRASRERLLQALYQLRVGGEWHGVEALRASFPDAPGRSQVPAQQQARGSPQRPVEADRGTIEEDRDFTERIAALLRARLEEIDRLIGGASRRWRPDRMAAVDLSVLRLATAELLAGTTPVKVAINEAIELARLYGTERSAGFVNGVLDGVAHSLGSPADDM